MDTIYVAYGQSIMDLLEEYGLELADAGVFEVECECGEAHRLEPDGSCTCDCGRHVQSPLLSAGMI